ncbi:hypothetical protein [Flavihumibacter sp. UBA7668]|uniref:hypothetical protein n=1 Tax=Flavihumibacter sp. UBA7668 TaxID=1946542 RepID=UPI0025C533C7|nr:hypothetical protein [Flavihumibacter sp. UBA7668]
MKTALYFLIGILLVIPSCKKLAELTQFNLNYNTETTIHAGPASNLPFDVFTPEITTASETEYEGRKTNKNLIQSIVIRNLVLKIKEDSGRTFDFLNSIKIYISTNGKPELLIASKDAIPDTIGNELTLDCTTEELKDYLIQDKYKLRLEVKTDKILNQDITILIQSIFRVDAKILGL